LRRGEQLYSTSLSEGQAWLCYVWHGPAACHMTHIPYGAEQPGRACYLRRDGVGGLLKPPLASDIWDLCWTRRCTHGSGGSPDLAPNAPRQRHAWRNHKSCASQSVKSYLADRRATRVQSRPVEGVTHLRLTHGESGNIRQCEETAEQSQLSLSTRAHNNVGPGLRVSRPDGGN
jgi:hypothetical protein